MVKESKELARLAIGDGDSIIRFILDSKTKSCYAWLALHSTHLNTLNQLKKLGKISDFPAKGIRDYFRFFTAEVQIISGDLVYRGSDILKALLYFLKQWWKGDFESLPTKGVNAPDWLPLEFPPTMLKRMVNNPQELINLFSFGQNWISDFNDKNHYVEIAKILKK